MFVVMLDINAVKRYKFSDVLHLTTPVEPDFSIFFIPGRLDPRNTIIEKLKEFGVDINPGHLVYKQYSVAGGAVYTISLYATFIVGMISEVSATIPITENIDARSAGILFPYRVVFLLPEDDTYRLLAYAQDLNTATKYVADVENNDFDVKVYFEENPYYDENATIETALSLYDGLEEE